MTSSLTTDVLTAARLREIRLRRGWSQERLARELGISKNTVWRWETGRVGIPGPAAKLLRLKLTNQ